MPPITITIDSPANNNPPDYHHMLEALTFCANDMSMVQESIFRYLISKPHWTSADIESFTTLYYQFFERIH